MFGTGANAQSTSAPIRYNGSVHERIVDLHLPSSGVAWSHSRIYNQRIADDNGNINLKTEQGYNWSHTYWAHLSPPNQYGNVIYWRDMNRGYVYADPAAAGGWQWPVNKPIRSRLFHVGSTGGGGSGGCGGTLFDPYTYRMQKPNGVTWVFHDFSGSTWGSGRTGKLWKIIGTYGQTLTIERNTSSGEITYVTDPAGRYFRYTYADIGNAGRMITKIEAWQDSAQTPAGNLIASIEFTYKSDGDGRHADCGSEGDLIQIVVKVRDSNDGDGAPGITRTTAYRYYSGTYSSNSGKGTNHQLRYILRPRDVERALLDSSVISNGLLGVANATIAGYVSNEFEYFDDSDSKLVARVKKETVLGAASSCCGGGGLPGEYSYSYVLPSSTPTSRNAWAIQTEETRPDNSTVWVELNVVGEPLLLAHFQNKGDNTKWRRIVEYVRDNTSGRLSKIRTPSAISDYNSGTRARTYVGSGMVYAFGYETESLLFRFKWLKRCTHDESDTSTEPTSSQGEMVESRAWAATSSAFVYRDNIVPTAVYAYFGPTADPSNTSQRYAVQSFEYDYQADSSDLDRDCNTSEKTDRIRVVKITLPTIATSENGSGVAPVYYNYFDDEGRPRWLKDPQERISYQSFDVDSDEWTLVVKDAYTSGTTVEPSAITSPATGTDSWPSGGAPESGTGAAFTWSFRTGGSSSDRAKLAFQRGFDKRGRVTSITVPGSHDSNTQTTYVSYQNGEIRVYPSWDATNGEPRMPMARVRKLYDVTGLRISQESADGTAVTNFTTVPDGSETWPAQNSGKWTTWSKQIFTATGQIAEIRRWHTIPESGEGNTTGTNTHFLPTTFKYTTLKGTTRGREVEMRDPEGGWTKTVLNVGEQVTAVYKTATEVNGAATNYTKVSEMYYGQATPGSGESLGGPPSAVRGVFGTGSTDFTQTEIYYDWKDNAKYVKHEDGSGTAQPPHQVYDYDCQDRTTYAAEYSSDSGLSASTVAATNSTNRTELSKLAYNNLGSLSQAEQFSITSSGTVEQISSRDKKLVTRLFYDSLSQLVAVDPPNTGVAITKYDTVGRPVETWLASEMEHTDTQVFTSTGAFDYANTDIKVIEKTIQTMFPSGAPKIVEHRELNHNDSNGTIDGSDFVATFGLQFYDDAGRPKASAEYGTNSTNGFWEGGTSAPTHNGTVPNSSANVLVTNYGYDAATGRVKTVTDPKSIITEITYDALGQVTQTIENKGTGGDDLNRTTSYVYDGLGNVKQIRAEGVDDYNGSPGSLEAQVTEYVRSDSIDKNWVREIRYPMPSTGQPAGATDYNDLVRLEYFLDGSLKKRTDQIGNIIDFEYDGLRRLVNQKLSTVQTPTDSILRRIGYTFNSAGHMTAVTSYDATTGGNVLNDVAMEYDGFSKLTKDKQDHDSAADSGSPYVEYGYGHSTDSDETSSQNWFNRLNSVRYPNGRYVWYDYGHSSTTLATMNNLLSRVGRIGDGSSSAADRIFAEYTFNGLGRFVQRDHLNLGGGSTGKHGNKTALRHIRQGTSGTLYPDFDRFGRLTNLRHINYNGTGLAVDSTDVAVTSDIKYGYDENSNRTFASDQNQPWRSHIYSYDKLNRLISDKFGKQNSTNNDWPTGWAKPGEDKWTLDILGNWKAFDQRSSDTAASETRGHNATNEVTTRTPTPEAGRFWVNDTFSDTDNSQYSFSTSNGWSSPNSTVLQCDSIATISGLPTALGTDGCIALAEVGELQDFQIGATISITNSAKAGGLVFGYKDIGNFWLLVMNRGTGKYELYEAINGAFTLRNSKNTVAIPGQPPQTSFDLYCEVRNGAVEALMGGMTDYASTTGIPAGKVGLFANVASAAVTADNFQLLSLAHDAEIDGRWHSNVGNVVISNSALQFDVSTASAHSGTSAEKLAIRRGFRGSEYVVQADCPISSGDTSGIVLHYQDPENFMAVVFSAGTVISGTGTVTPILMRRLNGDYSAVASGSTFSMTSGQTVKCAISDAGGGAQTLTVYVNGTARLTALPDIDDTWQGGEVGLIVRSQASQAMSFDNFKVFYDLNADGTFTDANDDLQIDDDFASAQMTLTSDHAGNLTDDGVFLYVYDAWNRLVKVTRRLDAKNVVAAYEYDGLNRRILKTVTNTGGGGVHRSNDVNGDGTIDADALAAGDKVEHYYYAGWRVIEETDAASTPHTLAQTVYGTQYIDEPVCRDRNTDALYNSGSSDSDCLDSGGSQRYFYHQDANFRVVMLTDESGVAVERYDYDAYGEPRIWAGISVSSAANETGSLLRVSRVGNPLMHQGLRRDDETGLHENRMRALHSRLGRFMQRDPLGYVDSFNRYEERRSLGANSLDPLGTDTCTELKAAVDALHEDVKSAAEVYAQAAKEAIEVRHQLSKAQKRRGDLGRALLELASQVHWANAEITSFRGANSHLNGIAVVKTAVGVVIVIVGVTVPGAQIPATCLGATNTTSTVLVKLTVQPVLLDGADSAQTRLVIILAAIKAAEKELGVLREKIPKLIFRDIDAQVRRDFRWSDFQKAVDRYVTAKRAYERLCGKYAP